MKYNVFARPMFKRGGISRGTGITSGLDTPRIGYAGGGRTIGGGMIHGINYGNRTGFVSPFPGMEYYGEEGARKVGQSAWESALEKARAAKKPNRFLNWLKKFKPSQTGLARAATIPGAGFAATAALPVGVAGLTHLVQESLPEELKGKGGIYDMTGGWGAEGGADIPPEVDEILRGKKVSDSAAIDLPPTAKGPPGGGDPDMFYKKPEPSLEESLVAPTKSEEDILLEQLGDTSLSKGEKALMLSEIIGQKGWKGKTDKAIELMKGKTKEDRQLKKDIAKLKYLQKGKEKIAGISAGALGATEKTIEAAINAKKAGAKNVVTGRDGVKLYDGKTEAQIRNEIYSAYTDKDKLDEQLGKTVLARSATEIIDLQTKIAELESKEKLSDSEQKSLDKKKRRLEKYKNMPGYDLLFPSFKEGGRVNYAQGTPMQEPAIAATQTEGANTTENTRPVNKLTFAELRNRLPKEITDDVVQLLSNSEEALQDFAYIKTQEDINKFNVKYGVNVILPPQA